MLPEWEEFLLANGACMKDDQVQDFGDPEAEAKAALTGNTLADLSYLSVVRITGADALKFLHDQFTCDLTGMPDGHVRPGAWCNPKGQVIASFIITRLGEEYMLLLPANMTDDFINRLGRFVFRAAVLVEDCSNTFQCIGINNRNQGEIPGSGISDILSSQVQTIQDNGLVMLHVPVNWNRVIIFGPKEAVIAAWQYSLQIYNRVGSQYWKLFDVLDGLPWIGPATSESFLPQYLNLDQTNGLSFSKGCYPGQEVIARLQHKGRIKQRLYVANLDAESPPAPGDRIHVEGKEQTAGTVINTADHPVDSSYALVILDVEFDEVEHLYIKDIPARFKKITAPPYAKY